jgi:hypothetical protein
MSGIPDFLEGAIDLHVHSALEIDSVKNRSLTVAARFGVVRICNWLRFYPSWWGRWPMGRLGSG